LVLTRVVSRFSHLLYGVRADDPVILLAVSGMLIGAAFLACYIPARCAASLEPRDSLARSRPTLPTAFIDGRVTKDMLNEKT
jgi:deoxycytidine triphosphate deaminase